MQDDIFDAVMLTCALVALGGLLADWLLRDPVPPQHSAASLARALSAKAPSASPAHAVGPKR